MNKFFLSILPELILVLGAAINGAYSIFNHKTLSQKKIIQPSISLSVLALISQYSFNKGSLNNINDFTITLKLTFFFISLIGYQILYRPEKTTHGTGAEKKHFQNIYNSLYLIIMAIVGMMISSNGFYVIILCLFSFLLFSFYMFTSEIKTINQRLKLFGISTLQFGLITLVCSIYIMLSTGIKNFSEIRFFLFSSAYIDPKLKIALLTFIASIFFATTQLILYSYSFWIRKQISSLTWFFMFLVSMFFLIPFTTNFLWYYCESILSLWRDFLYFGGLFLLVISSLLALSQQNFIKCILWNMLFDLGFCILAIASGGNSGMKALFSFLAIQVVGYIILFYIIDKLQHIKNIKNISSFSMSLARLPVLSSCFLLTSLSVFGLPPFGGFLSKFYIASSIAEIKPVTFTLIISCSLILMITPCLNLVRHVWSNIFSTPNNNIMFINRPQKTTLLVLFVIMFLLIPFYLSKIEKIFYPAVSYLLEK